MKQDPQPPFSAREPNYLLRAGMYGLAATAGVVTASFKVWDRFYTKMKHSALIKPLSDERYEQINALANKVKANPVSYKEYASQVSEIESAYSTKVKTLLKETVGIESDNIVRGTIQRFNTMGGFNKANVVSSGMIAVGTTLGAYFLINQNVRLKQELRDVHARMDNAEGNVR